MRLPLPCLPLGGALGLPTDPVLDRGPPAPPRPGPPPGWVPPWLPPCPASFLLSGRRAKAQGGVPAGEKGGDYCMHTHPCLPVSTLSLPHMMMPNTKSDLFLFSGVTPTPISRFY